MDFHKQVTGTEIGTWGKLHMKNEHFNISKFKA